MSAPLCICGHKKSLHSAPSENYDAPQPCEDPDCECEDYMPEDDEEITKR